MDRLQAADPSGAKRMKDAGSLGVRGTAVANRIEHVDGAEES